MQIIDFHTWFSTCKWKMNSACISEAQQVSIVCKKLQGPFLSAYMLASQSQTRHPSNLDELQHALSVLFAESRVKFTNNSIDMQFSAKSLVTDIKNFQTYVLHSSMSDFVQHNEFLYALLRSKMNTAKPSILLHASTENSLVLDPKSTFEQYLQQALHIAYRVHTAAGVKLESLPSKQQAQQPQRKTNRTQPPNPSSEPKRSVPLGRDLSSGLLAAVCKMKDDRFLQELSQARSVSVVNQDRCP